MSDVSRSYPTANAPVAISPGAANGMSNNNSNNTNKSSLFVGDLSIFCNEQELQEEFSKYGEVVEIKIMKSEETNRNLCYGFIKFSNPISAKNALDNLDGKVLRGRRMRVNWAAYRNKQNPRDSKQEELDTSPVHVSFISYQIVHLVTEESLSQLFSRFGVVKDVSIKKSTIEPDVGRQCGYGFVHFDVTQEGIQSAIAAAKALQDTTIDEVNYKSSISHNLNKMLHGEETTTNYESTSSPIPNSPSQGGNPTNLSQGNMTQFQQPGYAHASNHMPNMNQVPHHPMEVHDYHFNQSVGTQGMDHNAAYAQNISFSHMNHRGVPPNAGNITFPQHAMTTTSNNGNVQQNNVQQFRQQIFLTQQPLTHNNQITMATHPGMPTVHTMQVVHPSGGHQLHHQTISGPSNHHDNFISMGPMNELNQPQMLSQTLHVVQSNSPMAHQQGVIATTNAPGSFPSGNSAQQVNATYGSPAHVINGMHQNGQSTVTAGNIQSMPMAPVLIPVLPHPTNNGIPISPIPMGSFVPSSPPMSVHVITGPAPPPPGVSSWIPSPVMSPNINTMSNDSVRDDHVSYFVNQLLHSPNPGSSVSGYITSPIMSNGSPLVAYTPVISTAYSAGNENQNGQAWDNWNRTNNKSPAQNTRPGYAPTYAHIESGAAKNRTSNQHSPGSTSTDVMGSPSMGNTFNRDVVMSSAAIKNSKSASKSGASARTISNRFRKNLSLPMDSHNRSDGKSELDDSYNSNDGHD